MKVLVIHGSMRKNGNTGILADEFIRGAQEAGHETEKENCGIKPLVTAMAAVPATIMAAPACRRTIWPKCSKS